ncbi:helix-turn-helix domain-containing protein [Microbulbifer sp. SH-1]|uniref:helix-turn-helix domain-containing protein n=1 Tax=Microbulbifer sp. SH-1 TaxID=2681547 RepID=UPI00140D1C99|nr:helix-turn-helix domain-containing protein [Microbulbifer sp. SH-1]QIL88576.1 helix-turn-helix domain-containing protein [Microbulbifer sp. SH-1]
MTSTNNCAFGNLTRFWRNLRGITQEELALSLGFSTRHISFVETGKSQPSEELVDAFATKLKLGERDRCYLRLSAGYLSKGQEVDFHSPTYKWLRNAMLLSLQAMDPHPSALMDRYGNLLMVNRSWVIFHQDVLPKNTLGKVRNHYELLFTRPRSSHTSTQWQNTLAMILMSIQQEALLTNDPVYYAMVRDLTNLPNAPQDWQKAASDQEPMTSYRVELEYKGRVRSYYSVNLMVGALGPASFTSAPQLSINTLYPAGENEGFDTENLAQAVHPLLFF